jgi:hypothetical protein
VKAFDSTISETLISHEGLSDLGSARALVSFLEQQFELGSGKAGYLLCTILGGGLVIGSAIVREELASRQNDQIRYSVGAFPLLHDEAFAGDGEAMHFLSAYYQCGQPPLFKTIPEMYFYWRSKAIATGYGRDIGQL